MKDLARVRHVVLDMDGTLYRGARLFAQTLPFLKRLRSLGIGYTFLTNNTSLSKTDYVAKLQGLGIEAAKPRSTLLLSPRSLISAATCRTLKLCCSGHSVPGEGVR